jgi:hypothetical protein
MRTSVAAKMDRLSDIEASIRRLQFKQILAVDIRSRLSYSRMRDRLPFEAEP